MSILVKRITGKTSTLPYVDAGETVLSVKKRLEDVEGIPVDQQKLIFAGKLLQNEQTLSDYKYQPGELIHLCLPGLRAGPRYDAVLDHQFQGPVLEVLSTDCAHRGDCPVLARCRDSYEYTEEAYVHMKSCYHGARIPCRYGSDCRAHQRLIRGGERLDDRRVCVAALACTKYASSCPKVAILCVTPVYQYV
ncbi:ubq-1 [Symbiodinium natans]|uniref:Ubq-1 protein n=1 Tax=Symbiodinium natans TaxID=878477 RepID=A0A812NZ73_9DINO|nr:ubq-1 [Symbiodinium natans]